MVLLCLAWPNSAGAHPLYEHPERVVTGKDGRTLHMVKSYIDGLFFTDPVKLVIRDADDRVIAEKEYGRELAILCWSGRPCLVFRYDGLTPVLPTNVWRLEDGRLQDAQWLPPKDVVQVNVLRSVGWGGLTAFLSRDACTYLVLTARDGDPESR